MTVLITMTQQQRTQADEPVAPNAVDCPNQLQSYWKLDETSGPLYDDFVGINDATCEAANMNCPTPSVENPLDPSINGAQDFSIAGTTRVNIPANAAYDWTPASNFTIEFWMRVPADASPIRNQVIIGREAPDAESALHWWVGTTTAGQANFTLKDTDGVSHFVTAEGETYTNLHDGKWHHVAAVRLGNQGRLRLYVDGVQEGGAIADDYTGTFASATQPLNVGWLNYSPGLRFYYDGDLDELAIYRRNLSDAEILDHAQHRRSYCISASISLDKTASAPTAREGDTVLYTYTVTNDGNEDLNSVSLADDTCAAITGPTGDTGVINRLEIGETWTYTCSQVLYTTTTNIADVTAISATGVQVSDTDAETVTVAPIHPAATIAKQADQPTVVSGDVVVYSYEVQNIGDVELTNLLVTDDVCSPVTGPQGSTLAVAAKATFTCAQALTQATTNIGTVTANHQGIGGTVTDDSDPVTVQVINPGISLIKSASPTSIEPGETVDYQYTVRNIGDDTLTNVVVTDDKCSPIFGPQNTTLTPGSGAVVFSCSQVLNETTTNTGTVTATDSLGNTVTAEQTITVRIDIYTIYLPSVFNQYP